MDHPTGSDEFAAMLAKAGAPAPWRLCEEEPGEILDATSATVLVVDMGGSQDNDSEIALSIMIAVNTCAGFKAVP